MRTIVGKKEQSKFRAVAPPWEHFDGENPGNARCARCGVAFISGVAAKSGVCPNCIKNSLKNSIR